AAETCPALQIKVPAKFDETSKHDAVIPRIVDYGDTNLDAFFDKLARVARGTPGATLRIATYGDSNWTNDRTAGEIRRRLQTMFGDAGHGWVAFGDPWGWYHHQNLRHGLTGRWTTWNLATKESYDGLYGFAGISAESSQAGATVWVETAKTGDPVGTTVASFELYYLARPKGGSFEVLIDGAAKQIVDTTAAAPELKVIRYPVSDGAHKLAVKVKQGAVRLFGVVLERPVVGVVVDGIGVNALSAKTMTRMNQASWAAGLTRRNYDLVVETTGTNMWAAQAHAGLMAGFVKLWRSALPKASLLLWSPPDFIPTGRTGSEPRMKQVTLEKRDIARTNAIAFWDQYELLGGWGSMPKWHRERFVEPDGVHYGPRMNTYVGERFVFTILDELARRLGKNPRLGCGTLAR
ncbi:MAG: hypothetical protein ABI867_36680, partial [Kofleriaceae bacterium]